MLSDYLNFYLQAVLSVSDCVELFNCCVYCCEYCRSALARYECCTVCPVEVFEDIVQSDDSTFYYCLCRCDAVTVDRTSDFCYFFCK
nr:MAG TPA: hypothetical protein [Caudoviricetes sp.]